jgi:histidinol-phosphatase (PHP family)
VAASTGSGTSLTWTGEVGQGRRPGILLGVLPADDHVHSQWSYDTGAAASMDGACKRALAIGVPSVAFTEHLDFTAWTAADPMAARGLADGRCDEIAPLDLGGYLACVEECRARYPALRIVSGVEAGEPHLFTASVRSAICGAPVDRVLGSLHAIVHEGRLLDAEAAFTLLDPGKVMRRYLTELARLVDGSDMFEVLAHCDYPRRYWPTGAVYDEAAFEEEHRAVLSALARRGRVLEINTDGPLASVTLLRWWREEGGRAVSFGSDAHVPWLVGNRFADAASVARAAGFRPGRDPLGFWRC